jgi:superfamily II DNA or RNA helicase
MDDESADDFDEAEEDFIDNPIASAPLAIPASTIPSQKKPDRPAPWKNQLDALIQSLPERGMAPEAVWPAEREIYYVVDVPLSMAHQGLIVEIAIRERKKNGDWSKLRTQRIPLHQIGSLPNETDREILAALVGGHDAGDWSWSYNGHRDTAPGRFGLRDPLQSILLPRICQTGRCRLRSQEDTEPAPLDWDNGPAWEFWVEVERQDSSGQYQLSGVLRREEARMPLAEPALLLAGGLVFARDRAARLNDAQAFEWIAQLRRLGSLQVPVEHQRKLIEALMRVPRLPRMQWPPEFQVEEVPSAPKPYLKIRKSKRYESHSDGLRAELFFDYDGIIIQPKQTGRGMLHPATGRFLLRDLTAEQAANRRLPETGFRVSYTYSYPPQVEWIILPQNLSRAVRALVAEGWRVEAEGKLYRQAGPIRIEVRSGIDWFELHGTVEFGSTVAKLPTLLASLKRGEKMVTLDDGSFGMLPEEWLQKYGVLAGLGEAHEDHLKFSRNQAGLLDALLASQPEATCDALFERVREQLRRFEGIQPADPPSGFTGRLRGYQREGLGWLNFLQHFGFGGCLADDMGLGKTVQVLALLESRRQQRHGQDLESSSAARNNRSRKGKTREARHGGEPAPDTVAERPKPSLVVVPRSLVFNWKQEAARFSPQLRVLDHTGLERPRDTAHFEDYDLVLTTYGTLRRDVLNFKDAQFDYVILDEAQAIKNASTESAKAARLLRGDHRLALSGTPVENHLGELWSLFEFLNPGMLGSASVFRLGGAGARSPDEETRTLLARALRPFILRRTKARVAKELPAKLEQTLYCELEPIQRKLYNELREHYRRSLLGRIEREGLQKSKILVLEALLRLRQAACHPGLIDPGRSGETGAKLDMLLPQLAEVLEEDHKVLVFSQFTSLLTLVRQRLQAEKLPYLYLDGRTRDRGSVVERFQNDPDSRLFLISLKAGGLGLNLTAAEYVYLLDPWWNPAVEAQAIDRTHRIGQTRQVFAYRLIARDTVEENVLALQESKRDLADAIIREDNSLIRNLGREDLELLLS